MRLVTTILLLGFAEARAQPCDVEIARAPDDVRQTIETWVQAEPHCATPLEVRVIPTEGGYYLFARDPAGRVRERIVPDAQSAGVLVASWVADDAAPGTPVPEPGSTVIEIVPPAKVVIEASDAEPDRDVDPAPRRRSRHATRWLSMGVLQRMEGGGGRGMRGEVDLAGRGPWTFGASLSGSDSNFQPGYNTLIAWDQAALESFETRDLRAMAVVGRTSRSGAVELRLSAGVGLVHTRTEGHAQTNHGYQGFEHESLGPIGELSAQLSLRLGRRWAIGAGPLVTLYGRPNIESSVTDSDEFGAPMTLPVSAYRDPVEVSMFAALRHRM